MISNARKKLYLQLIDLIEKILQKRGLFISKYNWQKRARLEQCIPEGDWRTWMIMAGRGFGKTRTGAETIRKWVRDGKATRIALVAETISDAREIMVEGESGILAITPAKERPTFEPSKRKLTWPNGAVAYLYSSENYEQLRGPQFDGAWVDELAKFRYAQETWDQLQLGLRLGEKPQVIVTTTPKPTSLIKHLRNSSDVVTTTGTTFDNAANLSPNFLEHLKKRYEGTKLGAQEIYAEILEDTQGALFERELIRYNQPPSAGNDNNHTQDFSFKRVVVGIDPAVTNESYSDETGIVVAGITHDNTAYVLEDLSGKYSPGEWSKRAVDAYHRWKADRIVAEVNKGGDLVERVVRSCYPDVSYKSVRATRGKALRAEPIAALYEQKRVFHLRPFLELERQMCSYVPGVTSKSPDRIDALVWSLTELLLDQQGETIPKVWMV